MAYSDNYENLMRSLLLKVRSTLYRMTLVPSKDIVKS